MCHITKFFYSCNHIYNTDRVRCTKSHECPGKRVDEYAINQRCTPCIAHDREAKQIRAWEKQEKKYKESKPVGRDARRERARRSQEETWKSGRRPWREI
ncbi:hypothetical protein MMC21_003650 [Puttea exsequens]|nr:hypothetical protein [Puttea exsequens]